jgi:hypothetical protein
MIADLTGRQFLMFDEWHARIGNEVPPASGCTNGYCRTSAPAEPGQARPVPDGKVHPMSVQRFLDYLASYDQTRELAFDLTEVLEERRVEVLRRSA